MTALHINAPSKQRMGPEAKGGTADTTGAKGMANKKQTPVTKVAKPLGWPNLLFFNRTSGSLKGKQRDDVQRIVVQTIYPTN